MKKRQLTAEQIEKRDARRAKFRELWKQIADMPEPERVLMSNKVGIVTCDGRQLSVNNQCLLALQFPSVSVVGGFRQWKKHGRAVIKGQHGLMIWVPIGKPDETTGETPRPTAGEPVDDGEKPRFIMGTVFDISQTQEIGAEKANQEETQPAQEPDPVPVRLAIVPDPEPEPEPEPVAVNRTQAVDMQPSLF